MFRSACLAVLSLFVFALPGYAQSAVTLRTGAHDAYTRAVFDWPAPVHYEISEATGGELTLGFDSPAALAFGATEHGAGTNILEAAQISQPGEPLKVRFRIPEGSIFRHFLTGNRVVVDVFNPTSGDQKKTASATSKTSEPPKDKKETKTAAKSGDAPVDLKPMKPDPVEVEKTIVEQARPVLDPHVITLTTTESVGLAAFRRSGWLWLVLDRASVTVPPQIAGEQASLFGPFERSELKGGVAYRMKLPPESRAMNVYGEGGGLVWRVVITPNKREAKPIEAASSFLRENSIRGGTLTWPFLATTKVLDVPDPAIGDILKVVTVSEAGQFSGPARHYVDLDVLDSFIGMAVRPAADDLDVALSSGGVTVTRAGGLAVSRPKDVNRNRIRREVQDVSIVDKPQEPGAEIRRIFDFDRWMMGGIQALEENQRILLAGMAVKDNTGRVQDLLTLAKMNLSNDRGQEAVGYLSYAASELPDIANSPEFKALHGASAALAGKFELAFQDLFAPVLDEYTELDYWRTYTLASLEDWQQAVEKMPKDFTVLVGYPRPLLEKIGVKLAEVALRSGDVQTAEGILAVLQKDRESLKPWTIAAMDYLKGEAHRQSGESDLAKQRWEPLTKGPDDLYRAKAGLALTLLERDTGAITTEQAIDRLEGLRYAWRGDELEARINLLLGKMYLDEKRYMKGFTILRDSTSMSPESEIGREITAYMQDKFKDMLLTGPDISPLDAVQIYEEFRELTPTGDDGNKLVQKLAERLVEADLLDRAGALLEHQVEFRLQGADKARVAVRLGAIYLLDRNATKAMKYLAMGRDLYGTVLQGTDKAARLKDIDLLRARGFSQLDRTEEALEMLLKFDPDPVVNRLRADIAWQAGLWDDAAEALQDLILDEALDLNRPLTAGQADLLLNRAVALNLSGNRVALDTMRRRYEEAMKKTGRARLFDVVTRPRKTTILADREAIESIVKEVDMFKDFLETYRKDEGAVSN